MKKVKENFIISEDKIKRLEDDLNECKDKLNECEKKLEHVLKIKARRNWEAASLFLLKELEKYYFRIDRNTSTAKVFYHILLLELKGEKVYTWNLTKNFFKIKGRVDYRKVNELWSYLRELKKAKFITLEKEGKKYRILLTSNICSALVAKFYNKYAPGHLDSIEKVNKVCRYVGDIGDIKLLFLPEDCEDFVEGKSKETPLEKAAKRLWVLAYETGKLTKLYAEQEYNLLVDLIKDPFNKIIIILSRETMTTPDEKTVKNVTEDLKKKSGFDVVGYLKKINEKQIKKIRKKLIKSVVIPKLRFLCKFYRNLLDKARKGVWSDYFDEVMTFETKKKSKKGLE